MGWHRKQVPAPLHRRDGCHHCGRRAGKAIADHIPPNVVAYGQGYRTRLQVERPLASPGPKTKRAVSQALKLMGDALPCLSCSCWLSGAPSVPDYEPYQTIAQPPRYSLLLQNPQPRCLPFHRPQVLLWVAFLLGG